MKTLTDFKRELKTHENWFFEWVLSNPDTGEIIETRNGQRRVVLVQSNSVAFWREGGPSYEEAKANPHARAAWLQFPKASDCRFTENAIHIENRGLKMTYAKTFAA